MTRLSDFERLDPRFIEDLAASERAVWIVAQYLQRKGKPVSVEPMRVRDNIEDMAEFADHGDLTIRERIEVKHRNELNFNAPHEFPYPSIIVDVAHAWDRAFPKPMGYFITNADITAAFYVSGSTAKHWKKTTKFDNARRRERTFYECPLQLCKFVRLTA